MFKHLGIARVEAWGRKVLVGTRKYKTFKWRVILETGEHVYLEEIKK